MTWWKKNSIEQGGAARRDAPEDTLVSIDTVDLCSLSLVADLKVVPGSQYFNAQARTPTHIFDKKSPRNATLAPRWGSTAQAHT